MRLALVAMLAACCPMPQPNATTPKIVETPPAVVPDAAPPPAEPKPPVARTVAVIDRDFGLEVADPYRWMESAPDEVNAFLRGQGAYTQTQLAKLADRDKLYARIRELGMGVSAVWGMRRAGDRLFFATLPAGEQLGKLAVRDADGKTRVLVDPNTRKVGDAHVSLHAYNPSFDGKLIAYVISVGGGEVGELHIMDVATGTDLPDVIPRIWGEGSATWLSDGKRFFYTQMAESQPGVDPMLGMTARLHKLGDAIDRDITILGRNPEATFKLAPQDWPGLWQQPGTDWVIAQVGGAASQQRVALAKVSELDLTGASKTPWRIVSQFEDGIEDAVVHGDRLYLQTYKDAPNRKLISVAVDKPDLAKARVELAEDPDASISAITAARDAIYVRKLVNGRARLLRWKWGAKAADPIALPFEGWVPDLTSDLLQDGIVFQIEQWLAPGTYFTYDGKRLAQTGIASTSDADFSQIVAEDVEATSADGTKVSLSIVRHKTAVLDGSHPTLLHSYGAYGASQLPSFSATRLAWLERGGIFAVAHVRGGGEKGRRWQDDGSRDKKLNGIRDLVACAEFLVANHYTVPAKIFATGGSMGGVMVGRAITLRPDLFGVAQIGVGVLNPLRMLVAENGANQIHELGDPRTEAGYKWIFDMDPYLHVAPNTPYPAVMFTIGLNDHRVAPWMTAKMAARMQVATTGKPILVRIDPDAGHGIGSTRDQTFAERADAWAFALSMMQ